VPALEIHRNLTQTARVRNLDAFSSGRATVLVATDIAARGLHVDDVELVIHADPPLEHKTYLHRSGRTARARSGGTVVTLATEDQRADVARPARRAGVTPVVTQHRPGHPILRHVVRDTSSFPEKYLYKSSRRRRPKPSTATTTRGKRTGGTRSECSDEPGK